MDVTSIFKAVFALAVVLGLILALAYGLRRYAPNVLARLSSPRGRKRLEVVETLVLDPSRRVILVRVDDEERLILLGEGRELVEPKPLAEVRTLTEIKPLAETRAKPVPSIAEAPPAPRPRPVAVASVVKTASAPSQAPQAPPSAKLAAARAAYPRPPVQDANDDLF